MNGAGDGNRTHVTSLEGWSSTIELHPRRPRYYSRGISCQCGGSDKKPPRYPFAKGPAQASLAFDAKGGANSKEIARNAP
jgi:hypothetical protein